MLEDDAREALSEIRAEHPGVLAVLGALEKFMAEEINMQRFGKAAAARDLARSLREHEISPYQASEWLQGLELARNPRPGR